MEKRLTSCPERSGILRLLARGFQSLGPLALTLYVMVSGIVILALFRAALTRVYIDRFHDTPEYLMLFPIGVRMDLILLAYITIIPTALLFLVPQSFYRRLLPAVCAWYTAFFCFMIYMEAATFPFVEEYDVRPDQKFLEYLGHVREVGATLWKVYRTELAAGLIGLVLAALFFWKTTRFIAAGQSSWNYKVRLASAPFVITILVFTARSTLGHRPANISTAAFSENHLANELALNSSYSVAYSAYRMMRHEKNPSRFYGRISRDEVLQRVKNATAFSGDLLNHEVPFLQLQDSPFKYDRPPNVVIFLQESMGASDVGCLNGPDITPNLCALRREGMWFTNLYATGTRTVRGIEATVSGFLPTPSRGVVKLGLARNNFFTAASLFKKHGYETSFIYGGMSNFDEMRAFFFGNEFDEIYDEPTFDNPAFQGTWGVSDEDLVIKANEVFKSQGDKPFFSLLLSTSNHLPYEFPDGRIDLYEEPKQTHHNAIKYADYAIGLLFTLARREKYFKNTIFLIVADHNSHVRGNEFVPVSKFHIPGLMIGPNIPATEFSLLSSQVDLLPTLLHFTGLFNIHPMIGRNLMELPPGTPGRAFMQYGDNHAYRIDDQIVIHRPFVPAGQYSYKDGKLEPSVPDHEMIRDGLAHANLPWILYSERLYRLPKESVVAVK